MLFGTNGIASAVITDATREYEAVLEKDMLKDKVTLTDINPGDLVAYNTDNSGRIMSIALKFRANSPKIMELGLANGVRKTLYEEVNYT